MTTPTLASHRLKVALLQPQIAPNTGNIGRLCVATGTDLHIARPMGFVLSDKNLRRSGMDYWDRLRLTLHDDTDAFFRTFADRPLWLFTSKSDRAFWDVDYSADDCLIFGSETSGISESLLARHPTRTLRIPQAADERCLNLSTAAGVALYEALRQVRRR
jgi:tRNA (cytidine/uridine-2'-O-)-methyltransferase